MNQYSHLPTFFITFFKQISQVFFKKKKNQQHYNFFLLLPLYFTFYIHVRIFFIFVLMLSVEKPD